ncbi:MAG: kelch repeat-containing protein [Myxococcota bacterium]
MKKSILLLAIGCLLGACSDDTTSTMGEESIDVGIRDDTNNSDAPSGDTQDSEEPDTGPPPTLTRWSTIAPVPGAEAAFQRVVACSGKLFVLGGRTLNQPGMPGVLVTSVYAYDPQSDTWETHEDMPERLDQTNIAATEDRIFVLGARGSKKVWSYAPETRVWTELAERPVSSDIGASALAVDGTDIYVAGGVIPSSNNPRGARVPTFARYDTTGDRWEELPDMPAESAYFGAIAHDGVLYTNGGSTEMGDVARPGQTFAYDIRERLWTEKALAPAAVSSFAIAQAGGRMYVIGGITGASGRINFEVQVYEPEFDRWDFTTEMPTPRFSAAAASLDGRIYVVGGVLQVGEAEFEATTRVEVLGP